MHCFAYMYLWCLALLEGLAIKPVYNLTSINILQHDSSADSDVQHNGFRRAHFHRPLHFGEGSILALLHV